MTRESPGEEGGADPKSGRNPRVQRREFVSAVGSTVAAAAGAIASIGTVSGSSHYPHYTAQPDDVTLSYDESWLGTYAPRLVMSHVDIQPTALYGWRAESDDWSTDVAVYFAYYPTQQGVSSVDSHATDHEPVYVFVNDGSVEQVVWTGYHWLASKASADSLPMSGTHPTFRVADRYHHYIPTDKTGETVDLESLSAVFETWLGEQDMSETLAPGAARNPWSMDDRASWWRRDTLAGTVGRQVAELKYQLGMDGASGASDVVADVGWL